MGLTSGQKGVYVYSQKSEVNEVAKLVNRALRNWATQHAPTGFGWTSLQINVDTSSEWHYDHRNVGPSLLLVVGRYQGGEFETFGARPVKLRGEVTLIDGRQWHRNHAA